MKKITPYKTERNALAALDNGGRFYNLITKADDGKISTAELSKAAGVFSGKQQMVLFLEMSLSALSPDSRKQILSSVSEDIKEAIYKYPTQHLLPSEAKENGVLSHNAIVTGVPKRIDSTDKFTGFIMIPMITGKVTTFVMIPIIEQYDIYELRDEASSKEFLIAHSKSSNKLPETRVKCAGILKELKSEDKEDSKASIFLETIYYSVI
ncbi:MAG: hypothetical protein RLN81_13520 [Balneolaceae bacterium]